MLTLAQDLRHAARLARRRPALSLVTILTLAIGVPARKVTRIDPAAVLTGRE